MARKLVVAVFAFNALIFVFQALTKNIYAPLLVPLREAFSVGPDQAGLLVTLVFLGYGLARFPSGIMADRLGCTRTVLWGSLAMAGGYLLVGVAPNFLALATFTFILGVASGIYVTAGYKLAVLLGSQGRAATSTALFEVAGIGSGIVSPLLVTAFVLFLSWNWLFLSLGAGLLLVTLLFLRFRSIACSAEGRPGETGLWPRRHSGSQPESAGNPETAATTGDTNGHAGGLGSALRHALNVLREADLRRFLLWATLVGGFGAMSGMGINAFVPTFLVEARNYPYETANSMYVLLALAAMATKIGLGWLADRFGTARMLLVNYGSSIVLFFLLSLVYSHWGLIAVLLGLGTFTLNGNTLINAYVLRQMPREYQGTGFGLFSTAYTAIYSLGPYMVGLFAAWLPLDLAVRFSTAGALIAVGLLALGGRLLPPAFRER